MYLEQADQGEDGETIVRSASSALALDLVRDRLRGQFDWNVGLNQRAGTLIALNGLVLTLAPNGDVRWATIVGQAFLILSVVTLLWALRVRPERVGGSSFDSFARKLADAEEGKADKMLLDRMLEGTEANEKTLREKSIEIQSATGCTLVGLFMIALAGFEMPTAPQLAAALILIVFVATLSWKAVRR